MNSVRNWYIDYDQKTFQMLNSHLASQSIFEVVKQFEDYKGPQPQQVSNIPQWIHNVGAAISQSNLLLYNFFYVEQKLTGNQNVKQVFKKIYHIVGVENQYSKYFFIQSQNFRTYRIVASCLRFNRFFQLILKILSVYKKILDETFRENFDEVIIYIQKKVKETLAIIDIDKSYQINIILLDMLSLILRNSGDSTMNRILDKTYEKNIQETILKNNDIYQQFGRMKEQQMAKFQENKYIQVDSIIEEDPNKKIKENQFDNYQDQ